MVKPVRALLGALILGSSVFALHLSAFANAADRVTETVIYRFLGGRGGNEPQGGLVQDAAGNLYGTTYRGGAYHAGTVYELSPPPAGTTQWTHKVLYAFAGG